MTGIKRVVYWLMSILPLALTAYFYERMPNEIVMNWAVNGEVSYSPKGELFVVAGLAVVMAIIFTVVPKIDPRKNNYDRFVKSYGVFQFIMAVFLNVMVGIIISEALSPNSIDVQFVVALFVGGLFAVLGNMMPRFKSNYFIGIRTPWALQNTRVWEKTQRLGGKLFFASGLLIMAASFVLEHTALFVTLMGIMVICVTLTTYMSYIWYKQEQQ